MDSGITISANGTPFDQTATYKWGQWIAKAMFYTHAVLLLFFLAVGAWAMAVVNVFSVTCYILELRIIRRNPTAFLDVFVIEVLIHLVLAIFFVGWDCGFQYYAFAMGPVVFFSDHAIRRDGFGSAHPAVFGVLTMLAFLVSRYFDVMRTPIYTIDPKVTDIVHTVNGVGIITILWLFSMVYINQILDIEKALVQNADYDELTELANRHQLDKMLHARQIGQVGGPREYAVAIFDLDDFKKVNDRFGHLAGDQVLKNMAAILRRTENENTFVGRWGGEEFIAFTTGADAYRRLMEMTGVIRMQVESSIVFFEHWQLRVTVSIGVSGTTEALPFKELVEEADNCLYEAKGNGKNQVIGKYSREMEQG